MLGCDTYEERVRTIHKIFDYVRFVPLRLSPLAQIGDMLGNSLRSGFKAKKTITIILYPVGEVTSASFDFFVHEIGGCNSS